MGRMVLEKRGKIWVGLLIVICRMMTRGSKVPEPPAGHKWKEVRYDNQVAWLCAWTETIQGNGKYVMLNAASRVKGERDWQKYEKARKLHRYIDKIRNDYTEDWKSKEMKVFIKNGGLTELLLEQFKLNS